MEKKDSLASEQTEKLWFPVDVNDVDSHADVLHLSWEEIPL